MGHVSCNHYFLDSSWHKERWLNIVFESTDLHLHELYSRFHVIMFPNSWNTKRRVRRNSTTTPLWRTPQSMWLLSWEAPGLVRWVIWAYWEEKQPFKLTNILSLYDDFSCWSDIFKTICHPSSWLVDECNNDILHFHSWTTGRLTTRRSTCIPRFWIPTTMLDATTSKSSSAM